MIAVLVLLPYTSTAQQEAEKPPAALEQGQGIAIEAPAPQSETPKPPAQQEYPATQSSPAATVQNERPAEKPCGPHCQAAEQREKNDLEAQQSMAESAFDLVVISWWQFVAGTIGIALLLGTLWYTRKSTRAAIAAAESASKAVEITKDTAERQLRAYVMPRNDSFDVGGKAPDTGPIITMRIVNSGQTPAYDLRHWMGIGFYEVPLQRALGEGEFEAMMTLGPGMEADLQVTKQDALTDEQVAVMKSGDGGIYVWGRIEYRDAFGRNQFTNFRYVFGDITEFGARGRRLRDGNDAS